MKEAVKDIPALPPLDSPPEPEVSAPSSPPSSKRHSIKSYIRVGSRVSSTIEMYDEKEKDFKFVKKTGTVVESSGKSLWTVKFDNDLVEFRQRNSSVLTLLSNNKENNTDPKRKKDRGILLSINRTVN